MSRPEASVIVYNTETIKDNPKMVQFYEAINQKVSDILRDPLAKYGSIENMPTEEWSKLREQLLELTIASESIGEVDYE